MWSREALKTDARITLRNCFGNSILAGLVLVAINSVGNFSIKFNDVNFSRFTLAQLATIWLSMSLASFITILIQIFVANLLAVMVFAFRHSRHL